MRAYDIISGVDVGILLLLVAVRAQSAYACCSLVRFVVGIDNHWADAV
jgi:hypothetical protein